VFSCADRFVGFGEPPEMLGSPNRDEMKKIQQVTNTLTSALDLKDIDLLQV
jgi:hypothetical protein